MRYLIVKTGEPAEYGEAYASSLSQLEGSEEHLMDTESGPIKVREIPESAESEQVEIIRSRAHVKSVEHDGDIEIPPGEIGADAAEYITTAYAEQMVGIDKLREAGVDGEGAEITIHDTGIHPDLYRRYKGNVASLKNFTSDSDVYDTTSLHGSWIFSVLRHAFPEAKFHIHKVLSSENGSGRYSWIIQSVGADRSHAGNSSLSGGKSGAVNDAYDESYRRGVLQGVAAGNEQQGKTSYTADSRSPGTAATTMTVAAKRSDRRNAGFSSWGECVEYAAPGMYIQCADPDIVPNWWSGTSMAVYGVGTAAALRAPGHSKAVVRKSIYATATDLSEPPYKEGVGMLNAFAAYRKLAEKEPEKPHEEPGRGEHRDDMRRWSLSQLIDLINGVIDRALKRHGLIS